MSKDDTSTLPSFDSMGGSLDAVGEKSVPLLEKIKEILSSTAPERWEAQSDELETDRKYERGRPTWEEFYCTDVKSGVLVIRSSTPVKANYYGGGYFLAESGLPEYTVETRPRGWTPKMLIDPFFRSTSGIERRVQVLVEGEMARQLFEQIKEIIRRFRISVRRDFDNAIEQMLPKLIRLVHETGPSDWEQEESGEKHTVMFTGDLEGMKVEVGTTLKNGNVHHILKLSKYGLTWESRDLMLARDVFKVVDDCMKHASLEKLNKVLEEML